MTYYSDNSITILNGDCRDVLATLPDQSVNCCVTSPPYFGLRDYGVDNQIGLEHTPDEYIAQMVAVFREVKRVLQDDGTLWLNIGDSYNGSKQGNTETKKNPGAVTDSFTKRLWTGAKPKDLIGIPWLLAFALRADGWYLRQDIIWHKPNPMPESVTDRCTKAHEYIFLLSKSQKYYYNQEAVKERSGGWNGSSFTSASDIATKNRLGFTPRKKTKVPAGWDKGTGSHGTIHRDGRTLEPEYVEVDGDGMRNKRSVWTVSTSPYADAHFATFPPDLIRPCILAGCPEGGTVLDPFAGSGTTLQVAEENGCKSIGIELNLQYCELIKKRLRERSLLSLEM